MDLLRAKPNGQIGLWDMDGSLADFNGAMLRDLKSLAAPGEPELTETTDLHKLEEFPHLKARLGMIRKQPRWWHRLDRIEMGFAALEVAKRIGFENFIATKGPRSTPAAWKEKMTWCQAQPELMDTGVCMVTAKHIVYGKFLYDDFPDYMDDWLAVRERGIGIMPVTPYNKDYRHPRCFRYDGTNVGDLTELLQAIFERKSGESLGWVAC